MKPVMYLDIDGVLWDVDMSKVPAEEMEDAYKGANGVAEFMAFALENFEVRWLTAWGHFTGDIEDHGRELLARYTGVGIDVWAQVKPNKGWKRNKTEGISWDEHLKEGRPLVWIEDGISAPETQALAANHLSHRYYHTDVFDDPNALIKTHAKLRSLLERCPGLTVA